MSHQGYQKRIRRPTENQAVFMFTGPHGEYRRLCPALPSGLSCWVSLPGTWLKLPSVHGSNYGCFQSVVARPS